MNWYNKIKISQIWKTEGEDSSFSNNLIYFYGLEYKIAAMKNFEFNGSEIRKDNIIEQLEKAISKVSAKIKKTLISTFRGWLENHSVENPGLWAEKRLGGFEDIGEDNISSMINYESRIYYKGINPMQLIIENINYFNSLKNVISIIKNEEMERLIDELYSLGIEGFGENQIGEPFENEIDAKNYIKNTVENLDVFDVYVTDSESLAQVLANTNQIYNFAKEFYQYVIFPKWYKYWADQGLDETIGNVKEVYNLLLNSKTVAENHMSIIVAIQAAHQTGSMMDYLEEYGGEEGWVSSNKIIDLMTDLTNGVMNTIWDKQLIEIGVDVPSSVRKNNLKNKKQNLVPK